ncbi:MAG: hypothetical protein IIW75_01560 [Bacteroidaceae bacterium]|nr:hypothetical protein [Bacteroidaceae bacterium]
MEEKEEKSSIARTFEQITGRIPPKGFGEPFITAFSALYKGDRDEITVAAYTCSLFLSAILTGFPTAKLHTFVHNVQENHRHFSFNCKMYDTILAHMKAEHLTSTPLLNCDSSPITRKCRKEEIFEALDFYTNR